MNVLFFSTWFPYPPDNGSKLRVYYLLRALVQRHRVTLLSFAFDTAQPDEANELWAMCDDVQVVMLNPFAANRSNTLATFLSLRPMISRPIPAMSRLAVATWQREAYNVAIASTEMTADYVLTAPAGVVKILEEHNSLTRMMYDRYRRQRVPLQRVRCWASWQKRRWYEHRVYPRFDLVTMVSKEDCQATAELVRDGRPKIEVVPNGVDCAYNRPGLVPAQPNTLVYNGALTYSANYDAMRYFLADIYPLIRKQVPGVSLSITGSTQGVDLHGLQLDESVRLTGYVDDVRLPVARSAVCVVPIRQGGGTRLKILEAMALGTPVISTSKGAEGLEVADGEHLLIADDPQTFAQRTIELLRNTELRQRLAINARRLVEQLYDWRQIGQRFVELVEEIARQQDKRDRP